MTTNGSLQAAIGEDVSLPLPRLLADACTITLPLHAPGHMHASLSVATSGLAEANTLRVAVVPAAAEPLTLTLQSGR